MWVSRQHFKWSSASCKLIIGLADGDPLADILCRATVAAMQGGRGATLDLGRELSLAMALQLPAHILEQPVSPTDDAANTTDQVRPGTTTPIANFDPGADLS